jgi:Zn-dependent peptidase ImmA (M78 family)
MSPGLRAESLVSKLSIDDPRDIDVDAIAFTEGVRVEYAQLHGCEATLAGYGNHAIATVRRSHIKGRERFSVAHELGHWMLHRGRSFQCRMDDPDENLESNRVLETEADTFAAHLLMPSGLFVPRVHAFTKPDFRNLDSLAAEFETSLIATAMRLPNINTLPVVLACYGPNGRRWYKASEDIPKRWWLRQQLDDDTFAYDLLVKGKTHTGFGKQPAEAWFENDDAENYEVQEDCIAWRDGQILVLLMLESSMMDARFDPNVGNRRYNEYGSYAPRRGGSDKR